MTLPKNVKTYTVREVYDALAKNGFEHLREQWFKVNEDGSVAGGCVLGQAALNLSIVATAEDGWWRYIENMEEQPNNTYTLWDQLNKFHINRKSKWASQGEHDPDSLQVGDVIIFWNDLYDFGRKYYLPTYQDVVSMAYDVMEPFFDKKVYLRDAPTPTLPVVVNED